MNSDFDSGDPEIAELKQLMQKQSQEIGRLQAALTVDRESDELRRTYPDVDPNEVLQFAAQNGITTGNLELAYKAMQYDSLAKTVEERDATIEERQSALDDILNQKRGLPGMSPDRLAPEPAPSSEVPDGADPFDHFLGEAFRELSD